MTQSIPQTLPEPIKEILTVRVVTMDGGDATVKCPHCKSWVSLDRGDPRGEQFHHKACDGWFDVAHAAKLQFHTQDV